MRNSIPLILLTASFAANFASALDTPAPAPQASSTGGTALPMNARWLPGSVWFKEVETDFRDDKYRDYLKAVDVVYKEKVSHEDFKQQQKAQEDMLGNQGGLEAVVLEFRKKVHSLEVKRDRQLKEICQGHAEEEVCVYVQSLIDYDEIDVKDPVVLLAMHNPALNHIDRDDPFVIEFEHLFNEWLTKLQIAENLAEKQRNETNQRSFQKDDVLAKRQLAIQLELMDKLAALSGEHPTHPLSQKLRLMVSSFPQRAAKRHDIHFLQAMADGSTTPRTPTEKKVAEVVKEYYHELGDLTKQTFATKSLAIYQA